jgi:hypothetical protein
MAKSSGIGGTVVAIGVTLVGGYLTLVLLTRFMNSNAAGQQQTNGLLQSILKALGKGSGAAKAGGGSGGSGASGGGFGSAALNALKNLANAGEGELQQFNPFVDDTNLPLIDSQPITSALDALGINGFDPSTFLGPSTDNSTDSAGAVQGGDTSAWSVLGNEFGFDPSSFSESDAAYLDGLGGGGGAGSGDYYGGGDYGFESYAPAYDSAF